MLMIDSTPKFTMTVEVRTAALQGTMQVTYLAKPISETAALEKRTVEDGTGLKGFLTEVVADVSDIKLPVRLATDAEGKFESPAAAVSALVDWPAVGLAMQRTYYKGLWEETEKN